MGLIGKLRSARRRIFRAMEEQEARLAAYAALSPAELAALDDATLCEVMSYRNDQAVTALFGPPHKRRDTLADCYAALQPSESIYGLADLFALEMENNGLCGVLTGELRPHAHELSSVLRTIGADAHADLLDRFLADNLIDVREMSSFVIGHDLETDYAAQEIRFPYADFNRAYAELPPMPTVLAAYARKLLASV